MTVISKTIAPCGPSKGACTCPECGGLECLCRPNFFAGQLLTEEDLNRLDHYIRGRFRMHNLSLHGTGVVNGLKVLCDPCGEVKVTVGHAISPCGDDIIVCEDVAVPVCDLIRKCRRSERPDRECDPPRRIPNTDCRDLEEEWVLAIKYDERPTRGVVPLRSGACSSCGCGSNTCECDDCGCDACCEAPLTKVKPKPRTAPDTCMPTVICEGFRFCVYRKPVREPEDDDDRGRVRLFDQESPLFLQLQCCIELLTGVLPVMPNLDGSTDLSLAQRQALVTFCCRFRQNLRDYFARYPHTNCEVTGILANLRCPDAQNSEGFVDLFLEAFVTLVAIWLDAVKQCFCLALLPPAPMPTCNDKVPLATVRVRARDCAVLSICNWTTERQILISWPAISYWLGSLSIWDSLREALDRLCCTSLVGIFDEVFEDDDSVGVNSGTSSPTVGVGLERAVSANDAGISASASAPTALALSARIDGAWARVVPALGIAPDGLNLAAFSQAVVRNWDQPAGMSGILGAASPRFRFAASERPLEAAERANLPELLAFDFIGKPVLASFAGLGGEVGAAFAQSFTPRKPTSEATGASRSGEVAELRAQLDQQRLDIEVLKRAVGGTEE